MNAERYIKVLEQHMLHSRLRVFQQDNGKQHTVPITTAWYRSRRCRIGLEERRKKKKKTTYTNLIICIIFNASQCSKKEVCFYVFLKMHKKQ